MARSRLLTRLKARYDATDENSVVLNFLENDARKKKDRLAEAAKDLCKVGLFTAALGIVNNWSKYKREQLGFVQNGVHGGAMRQWHQEQTAAILRYTANLCLKISKKAVSTNAQVKAVQRFVFPFRVGTFSSNSLTATCSQYTQCIDRKGIHGIQSCTVSTALWQQLQTLLRYTDIPVKGEGLHYVNTLARNIIETQIRMLKNEEADDDLAVSFLLPAPVYSLYDMYINSEDDLLLHILAPFSGNFAPPAHLLYLLLSMHEAEVVYQVKRIILRFALDVAHNIFVSVVASARRLIQNPPSKLKEIFKLLQRPYGAKTRDYYKQMLDEICESGLLQPMPLPFLLPERRETLPLPLLLTLEEKQKNM